MTKYLLIFLLCSLLPLKAVMAQPTYLGTSPASGTIPTPEEFQNSIRAQQTQQSAQSNLNQNPPQDITIPPADASPTPAPANTNDTNTAPEQSTQPSEQAAPATQSSAPISSAPIPALPQTPGAQGSAAAPSQPQVYTGFQGNSNATTNTKTPPTQEKWNIRY